MKALALLPLLAGALGACAAPAVPASRDTDAGRAWLAAARAAPAASTDGLRPPAAEPLLPPVADDGVAVRAVAGPGPEDAGLLRLEGAARRFDDALAELLALEPADAGRLIRLAADRAPAVRAARAHREAARTGIAQAADLRDLLSAHAAFLDGSRSGVGPMSGRRAARGPRFSPDLESLQGEVARRTAAVAREEWRAVLAATVARARRLAARTAWIREREVLDDEAVTVLEHLAGGASASYEAGRGRAAAVLSFEAAAATERTRRRTVAAGFADAREEWRSLLDLDAGIVLRLDFPGPEVGRPVPPVAELLVAAPGTPAAARAHLAAERAKLALRLVETMAAPAFAGTAGVPERVAVGRGVRDAQVAEARARAEAAAQTAARVVAETRAGIVAARVAWENAAAVRTTLEDEVVPRLARAVTSLRSSFESGGAGYLDLLDAVTRWIDARRARLDACRAEANAVADLVAVLGFDPTRGGPHTQPR